MAAVTIEDEAGAAFQSVPARSLDISREPGQLSRGPDTRHHLCERHHPLYSDLLSGDAAGHEALPSRQREPHRQ